MGMSKEWIKKDYLNKFLIGCLLEGGKEGDRKKMARRRTWNCGRIWSTGRRP
jgi:hypothetical protein